MAKNIGLKATVSADASNFKKEMEDMMKRTGNVTKELKKTQKELAAMTVAYRQMSEEDKNSDFGKHLKEQINELTKSAADIEDARADVQQNIKAMASDTALWDGMAQGIGIVRDAVTAFATSMGVASNDGSMLAESINLLAKAQAYCNLAINVGNALQKQSKLMTAISIIQKKAEAAATDMQAAATGRATVAQKIFNTVAKANPYVLLATAIIAVGSALLLFAKSASEAKAKEEELNRQNKLNLELTQAIAKGAGDANKSYSEQKRKLELLTGAVKNSNISLNDRRKALTELKKMVPDYHASLTNEGKLVNNNTKALSDYAKKLKAVAEAQAIYNAYSNMMNSIQEKKVKLTEYKLKIDKHKATIQQEEAAGRGQSSGMMIQSTTGAYWQSGESKASKDARKALEDDMKEFNNITKDIADITKTASAYLNSNRTILEQAEVNNISTTTTSTKTTSTKTTTKSPAETITEAGDTYNKELQNSSALLKDNQITTKEYNKRVNDARVSYAGVIESNYQFANNGQKDILVKLKIDIADYDDSVKRAKEELENYTEYQKNISQANKSAVTAIEKSLVVESDKSVSKNDRFKLKEYGMSDEELDNRKSLEQLDEYINNMDEINELIKEKSEALKSLEEAGGSPLLYDQLQNQLKELTDEFKTVGEAADELKKKLDRENLTLTIKSFDGDKLFSKSWKKLRQEAIEGGEETQKQFSKMSAAAGLNSAGNAVNNLAGAFSNLADVTDSKSVEVAGLIMQAIANVALGAGEAIASAGQTGNPFVWIGLAAGITAEMVAIIASIKGASKFAEGGIVGGGSTIGDYQLTRLNSGEMVLNNTQQSRLFNVLNTGNGLGTNSVRQNGKVEFVIKNQRLVGTLNNYTKKHSRL